MKAKELMVGDWVYMKAHRGFDSQYIKVETIPDSSSDTHYGHIGAYPISDDMDFRDIEDSHLEPIPITQEILEKNGFEDMGFYSECKVGDWRVLCDTKNVAILHREHCNIDTPVEYVHELQHALRLCGIEKEIEL